MPNTIYILVWFGFRTSPNPELDQKNRLGSVTARIATPLSGDSKLTDAQLELCVRATKALGGRERERQVPQKPEV